MVVHRRTAVWKVGCHAFHQLRKTTVRFRLCWQKTYKLQVWPDECTARIQSNVAAFVGSTSWRIRYFDVSLICHGLGLGLGLELCGLVNITAISRRKKWKIFWEGAQFRGRAVCMFSSTLTHLKSHDNIKQGKMEGKWRRSIPLPALLFSHFQPWLHLRVNPTVDILATPVIQVELSYRFCSHLFLSRHLFISVDRCIFVKIKWTIPNQTSDHNYAPILRPFSRIRALSSIKLSSEAYNSSLTSLAIGYMSQYGSHPNWSMCGGGFDYLSRRLASRCPVWSVVRYDTCNYSVVGFCGQPHYCNRT